MDLACGCGPLKLKGAGVTCEILRKSKFLAIVTYLAAAWKGTVGGPRPVPWVQDYQAALVSFFLIETVPNTHCAVTISSRM